MGFFRVLKFTVKNLKMDILKCPKPIFFFQILKSKLEKSGLDDNALFSRIFYYWFVTNRKNPTFTKAASPA